MDGVHIHASGHLTADAGQDMQGTPCRESQHAVRRGGHRQYGQDVAQGSLQLGVQGEGEVRKDRRAQDVLRQGPDKPERFDKINLKYKSFNDFTAINPMVFSKFVA